MGSHSAPKLQCYRCGHDNHLLDRYPAKNATCHKCKRKGHFEAQCFSKTVAANELSLETAFLDAVTPDQESSWTVSLKLQDCEFLFKLDTGVEVTVVAEEVYKTLAVVELKPTSKSLYGPSHKALKVLARSPRG